MKTHANGLVVGKFAPLHHGHERLIRAALDQCEKLYVISYSMPEIPGCEPWKREKWLHERFPEARILLVTPGVCSQWGVPPMPDNDADADIHRRFCAELCLKVFGTAVDAVFTAEDYGDGFAAILEREFSAHAGKTVPVVHVRLDRNMEPRISGTLIRENVHDSRYYLSPTVYADFVHRICILGGESCGKSTLALALAEALRAPHVSEYGRELWDIQNGRLAFEDMLPIALTQIAREEAACDGPYLVCDTSPLTTLCYSLSYHAKADPRLVKLAMRRYDTVILCCPDIPFIQDGTRDSDEFRRFQHGWYKEQLAEHGIAYLEVQGSVSQRVAAVLRYLNAD